MAFVGAVREYQAVAIDRACETDEEIAHVTGYTVPMIRAVRRSS